MDGLNANAKHKTMKTVILTITLAALFGLSGCNKDRLTLESARWAVTETSFYTLDMKYYNDTLADHKLIKCISIHIETDTSYIRCIRYYTDSTHSYTDCQNWKYLIYEET